MANGAPRGLKAGLGFLILLAAAGAAAPLLATARPWVARGPRGLEFPAFRHATGLRENAEHDAVVVLRAPIAHEPESLDLGAVLTAPAAGHWLGTDGLGRDLAARLVHGARVSLAVGCLATVLALLLGIPLGALAGYLGGPADAVVSRCVEAVLCFPTLLLALALVATSPRWLSDLPDSVRLATVLGVTGWTPIARYLRAEFLRLRGSDLVAAARAAGAGHARVVTRHILPSALAPVVVTAAFAVGAAILLEASLSFLGLGVRPPTATWGGILTEAREHIDRAWWLALFPGSALFLSVLACNLVGEGVRDWMDPRGRRR